MVLPPITTLGLCAGVGMLDVGVQLALKYLGRTSRAVGYVERDAYAAACLLARMEDQALEPAPIWAGNLQDVRWGRWAGCVDGILAGFPCQPHSMAGNRAGTDDDRWTWPYIVDCLRLVRSGFAFLENVSGLRSSGGLDAVLSDLAALGFNAVYDSIRAADVDAGHQRERVFILAYRPIERSKRFGVHETGEWIDHPDTHWGCSILADASHSQGGLEISRGCAQERAAIGWTGESHDNYVANTNGVGRPQGRPEQPAQRWHPEAIGTGCAVLADAGQPRPQGRELGRAPEERNRPSASGSAAQLRKVLLADTGRIGFDPGRSADGTNDRPNLGTDGELPLFAPGPADSRWGGIVANYPYLAPAIEPGIRVLADGLAYLVDESRSDQLRCAGNGVVALQAAVAFVTLARRAGIF